MRSVDLNLFILIGGLLLIGGIAFIVVVSQSRKESKLEYLKEMVRNNSKKYIKLCEINTSIATKFHDIKSPLREETRLYSKQQYDRFDIEQELLLFFSEQKNVVYYKNILAKAEDNKTYLNKYRQGLDIIEHIPEISKDECVNLKIDYDKALQYEKNLLKEAKVKNPVTDPMIQWKEYYVSPAGRNEYKRFYVIPSEQISDYISKANRKKQEEIDWKNSVSYQRSLMTPGLRYDVMKRDHFKCVICGRSASDGAILHVDHIIPVSKGGKTELDNLQTLCAECNLGKSAKI